MCQSLPRVTRVLLFIHLAAQQVFLGEDVNNECQRWYTSLAEFVFANKIFNTSLNRRNPNQKLWWCALGGAGNAVVSAGTDKEVGSCLVLLKSWNWWQYSFYDLLSPFFWLWTESQYVCRTCQSSFCGIHLRE